MDTKHLVRVDVVSSRHSRHRSSRHERLFHDRPSLSDGSTPLSSLDCRVRIVSLPRKKYCVSCSVSASSIWKRRQRRVWNQLGQPYWLDNWKHKSKSAAHTTAPICVPTVGRPSPGSDAYESELKRTSEILLEALAHQLGQDAFDKAKDQASEVVAWEKIRREKSNLSEITALKARYDCLFRQRASLLETLRLAPVDDSSNARHKRWYYRSFALSLILAGIFFAHLALGPFGLGWETWVICFGIACVATFWTDRTLAEVNCAGLLKSVCLLALLASITGISIMALLRGDILAFYLKTAAEAAPFGVPISSSE